MTFLPEKIEAFLDFFDERKERIVNFPGCRSVKLLRLQEDGNIIFTLSVWNGPDDLEAYRHSDLFKDTWKVTKTMFADKAQAWSTDCLESLVSKD